MSTVCGKCVCEVTQVIPTQSPYSTDMCTVYNSTHVLCNAWGGIPSTTGTFLAGLCAGVVIIGFCYLIYLLFFDVNRDKKVGGKK